MDRIELNAKLSSSRERKAYLKGKMDAKRNEAVTLLKNSKNLAEFTSEEEAENFVNELVTSLFGEAQKVEKPTNEGPLLKSFRESL